MKFLNNDSNQICPKQGSELRGKSHLNPSVEFCSFTVLRLLFYKRHRKCLKQ